ncbi:cell wall biogenesis protein Ecm15 [Drechmeria coniospora]|uniref:Cell wall biogenesis protein Ecm15 n=1 Tax=Drechmeria coniospora TaxID=98403 RepID=A0A151GKZ2_DRECN|nr:cell wall biogenesis protein Ecm15 [Drechmeria coniospora]KYK57749.1 cell wall biogenesis protein Ecm15 [Drechmeria coniospora]
MLNQRDAKVGTGTTSVAEEVAEVQRLLKASGLRYTMHSAGTTVERGFGKTSRSSTVQANGGTPARAEGSWDEVMAVVGKAHTVVHRRGVVRVQLSMRVGSRHAPPKILYARARRTAEEKVKRVEKLLADQSS